MKWSHADTLAAYKQLFEAGKETGLVTVSVQKTRALRKVQLETMTGKAQEVDAQIFVDRGQSALIYQISISKSFLLLQTIPFTGILNTASLKSSLNII